MNKTRIVARIIAGTLASAVLAIGTLAAPAQAKDSGWPVGSAPKDGGVSLLKDSGWPVG
jgi:hypothetical protein